MSVHPSQARRRGLGNRLTAGTVGAALAVSVAALPAHPAALAATPAKAATVKASASTVDQYWWVADALLKSPDAKLVPAAYYQKLLQTLYLDDPTTSPTVAKAQFVKLQHAVTIAAKHQLAARHGDQAVPGLLRLVRTAVSSGTWDKGLIEATRIAAQYFASKAPSGHADGNDQVLATADLGAQDAVAAQLAPSILATSVKMARDPANANYRKAENAIFAGVTAPTSSTARKIVAANPAMAQLGNLNKLIGSNGAINTTAGAVNTVANAVLEGVRGLQGQAQSLLGILLGEQTDIVDWTKHAAEHKTETDADKKKAKEEQDGLSVANSAVTILSKLIGLSDPKAGKILNGLGTAWIKIATNVSKFFDLAASMGVVNALTSVGGAALTGNIIGAVFSIIGLFSGGDDVNKQILTQIGELRNEIADLGQEMDKRFDRVDAELNTIYSSMMDQFNRIDVVLGTINGNVDDALDRLQGLQTQVANLEGGLWSSLRDGFRRPLWNEIDYALGYQGRTGHSLPKSDYLHADSEFYTWGTKEAYDAAAVGPPNRDTDEAQLADQLNAFPLDADLSFLNTLPISWGMSALVSSSLPNPHDWYLAARAYNELALDYPALAQSNHALASEIANLKAGGAELQAFEHAVSGGAPTAHGAAVLNPLFATLLNHYDAAVTDVHAGIVQIENDVHNGMGGADPFGGINQSFSGQKQYPGLSCYAPRLISPATAARLVPGAFQIEQSAAKVGKVEICANGEWDNETDGHIGKIEYTDADLVARIYATWSTLNADGTYQAPVQVLSQHYTVDRERLCSGLIEDPPVCNFPDANGKVFAHWTTVAAHFAGLSAVDVLNPAQNQALIDGANAFLAQKQQEEMAKVVQGFTTTEPTHSAARRITGVATALRDYVQLGMPNTYAGDEVLAAMLDGSERILDGDALAGPYFAGVSNPPAVEPWAGLQQTLTDRETALANALAADLAALRAGNVDGSTATATTMDRLSVLNAIVTSPGARFSGASVTLPATRVHHTRSVALAVRNPGIGVLHVTKATATGSGLAVTAQTCGTVGGHAVCHVTVRFAPSSVHSVVGALTLKTNTARGQLRLVVKARSTK